MSQRQRLTLALLAPLLVAAGDAAPPPPAAPPPAAAVVAPDPVTAGEPYVKGYELGTTKYADIKEMLEALKSPRGHLSHVPAANKLLVNDVDRVHQQVRQILDAATGRAINITIDVEFVNVQELKSRGIKLSFQYEDGSTGRLRGRVDKDGKVQLPQAVAADFKDQTSGESRYTQQSLTTASGRPAQLWVTTTALDKSMLGIFKPIPFQIKTTGGTTFINTGYQPEIIVRELGSSLWVQPTYLPNGLVAVDVFPVVSYETTTGGEQSFRFEKVKTSVVVQPEAKLLIGGGDKAWRDFFRDLFGTEFRDGGKTDALSIYLTAHVQILDLKTRRASGGSPSGEPQQRRDLWRHFPD